MSQIRGTHEIANGAPVIDQVGRGRERKHVVVAEVVAAALEDMFTLL